MTISQETVNKYSEKELIALVQEGNITAFDELYRRNWRPLFTMACNFVQNNDDAKDLVQDVFISLWNNRMHIDATRFCTAYLFTALKNNVVNFYKKDLRKRQYAEYLLLNDTGAAYTGEDSYIAKELGLRIAREIDSLPKKMQQIFVLSRRSNMSVNEISEMLHLTQQTVKNQLSNALRILRTKTGIF